MFVKIFLFVTTPTGLRQITISFRFLIFYLCNFNLDIFGLTSKLIRNFRLYLNVFDTLRCLREVDIPWFF